MTISLPNKIIIMIRKSYTVKYKISVIEYASNNSITAAVHRFKIHRSMISRWMKQQGMLKKSVPTKRRIGNPGRTVAFPDQERSVYDYITASRANHHPVSYAEISQKMKSICPREFKASTGWLYGFLYRFHLSLRRITNTMTKNVARKQKSDQEVNIKSFCDFVTRHSSGKRVVNMDETPVWLSIGSTGQTVETTGSKKVSAIMPVSYHTRVKYSVILACDSEGNKLAPAVIAESGKNKPRISLVNGVLVFHNPGTSMSNSRITSQWMKIILGEVPMDTLLVMDSFKGHLTDEVKETAKELNVTRAIIPGGFTSELQPLDISVNRSFKAHLKRVFRCEILKREEFEGKWIHEKSLRAVTHAVRTAWGRVKRASIVRGFTSMLKARQMRNE